MDLWVGNLSIQATKGNLDNSHGASEAGELIQAAKGNRDNSHGASEAGELISSEQLRFNAGVSKATSMTGSCNVIAQNNRNLMIPAMP